MHPDGRTVPRVPLSRDWVLEARGPPLRLAQGPSIVHEKDREALAISWRIREIGRDSSVHAGAHTLLPTAVTVTVIATAAAAAAAAVAAAVAAVAAAAASRRSRTNNKSDYTVGRRRSNMDSGKVVAEASKRV
uniref:Uncharacterized protein n=1 Tax=Vespula pensylvanica TaxID=30213 RepID=A0A834KE13_VESPE|nr:hypothetical protein H0235_014896 [Vespula pensylvanica]